MSRPTPPAYKTRNWPAYNEALKCRGSLTIWFDPAMAWEAAPTGKRGRQPDYSGEEDQKTARVRAQALDPGDQVTCDVVFPPNAQAWRHEAPLAPVSRTGGETVARLAQNSHRN